jgi:hypothetical protein
MLSTRHLASHNPNPRPGHHCPMSIVHRVRGYDRVIFRDETCIPGNPLSLTHAATPPPLLLQLGFDSTTATPSTFHSTETTTPTDGMAPDLATQVLHALNDATALPLVSTDAFPNVESTVLKGALDSLLSRDMVAYETLDKEVAILTEEGAGIVKDGSHEAKVYEAVCKALDGLKITELAVSLTSHIRGRGRVLSFVGCCGCGERKSWTRQGIQGGLDQEGG